MKHSFNLKRLAKDILAKRIREGLSFNKIEEETKGKLTRSMMQRIEAEQVIPQADKLADICNWLAVPVQNYFLTSKK